MKLRCATAAFTLVESLTATALVSLLSLGLIGLAIFAGKLTKSSREKVAAAEIAEAKLEALRSCSWSQILSNEFVPISFSVTNGVVYSGTIQRQVAPIPESYQASLVQASVVLTWQSDTGLQTYEMSTFISPYGLAAR